jgi:hypothetical protein
VESPVVALDYVGHSGSRSFVYVRDGEEWQERAIELDYANYVEAAVSHGLRAGDIVGRPEDVRALNGKPSL